MALTALALAGANLVLKVGLTDVVITFMLLSAALVVQQIVKNRRERP